MLERIIKLGKKKDHKVPHSVEDTFFVFAEDPFLFSADGSHIYSREHFTRPSSSSNNLNEAEFSLFDHLWGWTSPISGVGWPFFFFFFFFEGWMCDQIQDNVSVLGHFGGEHISE